MSVVEAIRSLFVPMESMDIIIPNSAIAEVIGHQVADQEMDSAPDWMLGRLRWREQLIPLISFENLVGVRRIHASSTSRLVIIKCLAESSPFNYYAIETKSTPKVLSVYPFVFEPYDEAEQEDDLQEWYSCRCMLNGEVSAIPDIEKIEAKVVSEWTAVDYVGEDAQ